MPQYLDDNGEPMPERTMLPPAVERAFQAWAQSSGITDVDHPDSHYDYRGYFLEKQGQPEPPSSGRHFPDTFKQHGHPTFSQESKYSTGPGDGGTWNGEQFVPAGGATYLDEHGNPQQAIADIARTGGVEPSKRAGLHPYAQLGQMVTENLPTLASLAAGLATGGAALLPALGISTAAAGAGAGGRAMLRLAQGQPAGTLREAATDTLVNGPLAEVGGRAMSGALTKGGQLLYRQALGPAKALQREFPDLIGTGLRERIPVGAHGLSKVERLESASTQAADDLVKRAAGGPIRAREVTAPLKDVRDTVVKEKVRIGLPDQTPELAARARALKTQGPFDLFEAQALKRRAQSEANTAYRAQDRGAVINQVGAHADKAVASGFRKAIERRVPEVGPINQRTQQLEGLRRALEDAGTRPHRLTDLIAGAGGIGTAGVTGDPITGAMSYGALRALMSPTGQSVAAIGAHEAGNVPWEQLIRTMLLERLGHETP